MAYHEQQQQHLGSRKHTHLREGVKQNLEPLMVNLNIIGIDDGKSLTVLRDLPEERCISRRKRKPNMVSFVNTSHLKTLFHCSCESEIYCDILENVEYNIFTVLQYINM